MGESNPLKRVLLLPLAAVILAGCGTTSDQSNKIAAQIGAASCTEEPYEILNRLDNSKTRLYSCDRDHKTICVTEQDGIPRDVTAEARILWQGTLGSSRPDCLG